MTVRTADVPPFPVARLTIGDYHQMISLGVLGPDDRLELLDGWLAPKTANDPPHAARVQQIAEARTVRFFGTAWAVQCQLPITLASSEPEPDVAIVRRSAYDRRHPHADDVALVIEVADSSLRDDRVRKARIYAAGAVARYLIVNVQTGELELSTEPDVEARSYRNRTVVADGVIDLGDTTIPVEDLLVALPG